MENLLLKKFKYGRRNYKILKLLLDAKGEVVQSKTLIVESTYEPLVRKMIPNFNNPVLLKKEKGKLKQTIAVIRRRTGKEITFIPEMGGYKLE